MLSFVKRKFTNAVAVFVSDDFILSHVMKRK